MALRDLPAPQEEIVSLMKQHASSGGRNQLSPVAMDEAAGTNVIRIPAPGAEDISLGVLQKCVQPIDPALPPLLLVHGATIGATIFDLSLPGYSLMASLATAGRAVYAVDIRGYGYSMNGAVMAAPPGAHAPFPKLSDAVADIGAAIDLIRARENADVVDLVGFSWGTVTSALYAGEHANRVARLVLYAPLYGEINRLWLGRIAEPSEPNRLRAGVGAYRLVTQADLTARWNSDLATDDPGLYRECGVAAVLFDALSALDSRSHLNRPPAFRCPSGALVDLLNVFNGRPLYDPGKLTMPVLLLRGSNDTTSTDSDARRLLSTIASADKRYCIISPGSHFLILEKSRHKLNQQLHDFLGPLKS